MELAAGQGIGAKAALLERVPYVGLVLGEVHARRLEMMLTEFIFEQMKEEGSVHYRPEACGCDEDQETGGRGSKRTVDEQPTEKPPKKPKKGAQPKPKSAPKPEPPADDNADEGEGGEGAGEGHSPLPW